MRGLFLEAFVMFLLGGLVMLFVFFVRAAWKHAEVNEKLTKRNAELERENAELKSRVEELSSRG